MYSDLTHGQVIAAFGKRYLVELADKRQVSCVTRGKKTDLACGDFVGIQLTDHLEGVVEQLQPRNTLLFRSNAYKSKLLAANVTQVVIVLATSPSIYEGLLNRCIVAAEAAGIKVLIVLNKCDLPHNDEAYHLLDTYIALGYDVLKLSAKQDITPLKAWLEGNTSVLVGQSGMGKSTIINALIPDLNVRTQEVSNVLDSGKHTTTAAHLYHLNAHSQIIDSPGMQEFGLYQLSVDELEQCFIEFKPFLGKCRFQDCKHLQEPDCALQAAVKAGHITQNRLDIFQSLAKELAK